MSSNSTYKPAEYKWGEDEISIDTDSLTIDMSSASMSNYMFSSPANQTYSISTGATGATGSMGSSWTTNSTAWPSSTFTTNGAGLHVTSNAVFDGDVTIKGSNIAKTLKKIEDRLAILQDPDPAKLEKFAALKKAYDNYKMLERLIGDDSNDSAEK
jgi:hypothetical protein